MNENIDSYVEKIKQWHNDRGLIEGSTPWAQTKKLLEEFTELVAAQKAGESPSAIAAYIEDLLYDLLIDDRIKTVEPEDASTAYADALGDMIVVQVNLAEQVGESTLSCVESAWDDIKERRGKLVGGIYVKEEDLIKED